MALSRTRRGPIQFFSNLTSTNSKSISICSTPSPSPSPSTFRLNANQSILTPRPSTQSSLSAILHTRCSHLRHQSSTSHSTKSNPSISSSPPSPPSIGRSSIFKSPTRLILSISGLTLLGTILTIRLSHDPNSDRPLQRTPLSNLFRSFFVYSICSLPFLVDLGPGIIEWCRDTTIPGVWKLTEFVVRNTFFKQFVGAETSDGCVPVMSALSRSNLGTMLNFSIEVDHHDALSSGSKSSNSSLGPSIHTDFVKELVHSISVASHFASAPASFGASSSEEIAELESRPNRDGSTMVAIKLSGLLLDSTVLERSSAAIVSREWFSSPPTPLPPRHVNGNGPCAGLAIPAAALDWKDVKALNELMEALRTVARKAQEVGNVRICLDAEYSWYQPAIDALFEAIASEFNCFPDSGSKESQVSGAVQGPIVFNTYQTYLRRTPSHLAASLDRARMGNYSIGVKLVRGAYVDAENNSWAKMSVSPPPPGKTKEEISSVNFASPVWATKNLTDQCYNGCAIRMVDEVAEDLQRCKKTNDKPRISVMFASHNVDSSKLVTKRMVEKGLAVPPPPPAANQASTSSDSDSDPGPKEEPLHHLQLVEGVRGRICFGQLFGMADNVTRGLQAAFDPNSGGEGPHMCSKYLPYGPLNLVMPYLIRRAAENKSVMGGGAAAQEIKLVLKELSLRITGA